MSIYGKKRATHIEFILAFILFITFAIFAIYLFNPTKTSRLSDSSLPYVVDEIVKNTSVDLITYSIKINKALIPVDQKTLAVEIGNIPVNDNIRVEDYGGQVLNSKREGDIIYFDFGNSTFAFVKFCEDFNAPNGVTKTNLVQANLYELASSTSDKIISEKRVQALEDAYSGNYEELRNKLQVPSGVNFDFILTRPDGSKIGTSKNVPTGLEVFSDSKRREILNINGESEFADLNIRVW